MPITFSCRVPLKFRIFGRMLSGAGNFNVTNFNPKAFIFHPAMFSPVKPGKGVLRIEGKMLLPLAGD
jgi:hypothetical protein